MEVRSPRPAASAADPTETPLPPTLPAASAEPAGPNGVTPTTASPPPYAPTQPAHLDALLAEIELPSDSLPDPATKRAPLPPLLASEALMEDLAPVEPARREARVWCAGVGGASLLFGMLPLVGLLPGGTQGAIPWLVTGAIALVAGVTPVTYRQRAVAMVVLGLLSGVVALQGAGALVVADGGPAWGLARLFAVVVLSAALLFRGRYRAYAGARVFLGTALCIALPFGVHTVLGLFGAAHAGGLPTAGMVAALCVLLASLAGFMGAETTGAGTYLAPATVVTLSLDLALRGLGKSLHHGTGGAVPLLGVATDAVAFGGAAALAALGVFQILAWRFAADARRIDLHPRPRESRPPDSDRDPASEWSTRD